jgi:uncharacterized Ntn-hydrolase superfamily protein
MTFSICVREQYEDEDGDEQYRFGVAVTTRLAGVGTLCPFANEYGAVATQSLVNVELGEKGIEYLADGLGVEDALQSLLNADEGAPQRQLHGVGSEDEFAFSGEECKDWFGHSVGENYTVAGNLLTGESVIEATALAYEESDRDRPLAFRLADALAAGHEVGGDKREDLHVQSAAVLVRDTADTPMDPYYNDIRIDATETPIADLQETLETANEGYEMAMDRYADAYEDDEIEDATEQ